MNIAILISGRGSNMQALCEQKDGFEICLVAADRPAAGLELAQQAGYPTTLIERSKFTSKQKHEAVLADQIARQNPDWIVLAGYMAVLSAAFIARFEGRVINIHPSLLPRYKGLNTHARVLAEQDLEHGASVHLVTAQIDEGPLLAQAKLAVEPQDTPNGLSERVLVLEHQLYPAVVSALAHQELSIDGIEACWKDTRRLNAICGGTISFPPLRLKNTP